MPTLFSIAQPRIAHLGSRPSERNFAPHRPRLDRYNVCQSSVPSDFSDVLTCSECSSNSHEQTRAVDSCPNRGTAPSAFDLESSIRLQRRSRHSEGLSFAELRDLSRRAQIAHLVEFRSPPLMLRIHVCNQGRPLSTRLLITTELFTDPARSRA